MSKQRTRILRPVLLAALFLAPCGIIRSQPLDTDRLAADEQFRGGVEAFHSGYYGKAIQSFEAALSFKPEGIAARTWLGRAFYQSGRVEQALHEWNLLSQSGVATSLHSSWVSFIEYRRSLARELSEPQRFVMVQEIISTASFPFSRPTAVEPAEDGSFYLASWATNQIVRYDGNGRAREIMGGGLQGFNHPYDVVKIGGALYVSEFHGNRIAKCGLSGAKLLTFGESAGLLGPQSLACDDRGYLYVTDIGNRRIVKFDLDGNYILEVGDGTSDFPGFSLPTGIAFSNGKLFVADRGQRKIHGFDGSGNYLGSFGSGLLTAPEGLFFRDDVRLLIADGERIVELDIERETVAVLARHSGRMIDVALDANGNLLAVDHDIDRILFHSEVSSLYTGYFPLIRRIDSQHFPQIVVDVSISTRDGRPVLGLDMDNIQLSEFGYPVQNAELAAVNPSGMTGDIVILFEKSAETQLHRADLSKAVEDIHAGLPAGTRIELVSIGEEAVVEAPFGATRLQLKNAISAHGYSEDWRFDEGLLTSVSELLPSRTKRTILFLSSSTLGSSPYSRYTLMELAEFLRGSSTAFFTIYLQPDSGHPDLEFLCSQTGGSSTFLYRPEGVGGIIEKVRRLSSPLYFFKYVSPSKADFGKRYISLQLTVPYQNKTGRDESGYFAPLIY